MNSFELYLVKSSAIMIMLYIFYSLFLKKETSYKWNRFFLLFSGVFSMIIPLFNFTAPTEKIGRVITVVLSTVNISAGSINSPEYQGNWDLLMFLYLTLSIAFLMRFLFRLYQILSLIKNHKGIILKGYRTILLEKMYSPFSFFSTIFLPKEKLADSDLDKIIEHEAVHICENHTYDIIIFELITILQWFNPFVWMCRKELIAQHEFAADSELIKNGMEKNSYLQLLLSYSMQLGGTSVTNNFNSLLKRRYAMLARTTSDTKGKVKILFSVPLILLLAFLFGCKSEGVNSSSNNGIMTPNSSVNNNVEQPFNNVDEMPTYPEGQENLLRFISSNVVYPKIAKGAGVQGRVVVGFIVEKDGSTSNFEIVKGIGSGCDEEALRVCKLMGRWNPAKKDGKPVSVKIFIPFQFKLQ